MTAPDTSAATDGRVDVDALPPTQYLVLDVLAARWRVGERLWTFPSVLSRAARALERLGLVAWKRGVDHGTIVAWLTEAGRDAVLDPDHVLPLGTSARREAAGRALHYLDELPEDDKAGLWMEIVHGGGGVDDAEDWAEAYAAARAAVVAARTCCCRTDCSCAAGAGHVHRCGNAALDIGHCGATCTGPCPARQTGTTHEGDPR